MKYQASLSDLSHEKERGIKRERRLILGVYLVLSLFTPLVNEFLKSRLRLLEPFASMIPEHKMMWTSLEGKHSAGSCCGFSP